MNRICSFRNHPSEQALNWAGTRSLRYFVSICSCLLLVPFSGTAQEKYADIPASLKTSILDEQFADNTNHWILNNNWVTGKIGNNSYLLTCNNFEQSTGISAIPVMIDLSRDFEIESAIRILKGSVALVFGMNDKFDHYRLEISEDKKLYFLLNLTNRQKVEKLYASNSFAGIDPKGINKVSIRKMGGDYFLFVNAFFVGKFPNLKLFGNQVGFSVAQNSTAEIQSLTIQYIRSEVPSIAWITPGDNLSSTMEKQLRVKATIHSDGNLDQVKIFLNGTALPDDKLTQSTKDENGNYFVEGSMLLNNGENKVFVQAANLFGNGKSEERIVKLIPANPPEITWESPGEIRTSFAEELYTVQACINSPSDIQEVQVYVNGELQSSDNSFSLDGKSPCKLTFKKPVFLRAGENSIYILASNANGTTTSEKRTIALETEVKERRLALVIGNAAYNGGSALKNPVNDANLMEATLKSLHFDVIKQNDASLSSMMAGIHEFSKRLPDYNVALFYYAGHGMQLDGINYLIPVDAKLEDKNDVKFEAVSVNFIVDEFEKYPDNTNIVILDACRNNPFRSWARGGPEGFKAIPAASGTLISFATSEGATAADGLGKNGLFTQELVKQMVIPQQIESVFKRTRVQVEKISDGAQSPQEWSKLKGDFFFVR